MDRHEQREADVEGLARTLGEDAARLRGWVRAVACRQRVAAQRARACTQRAALARDNSSWLEAREQAEIDREARSSARRMADYPMMTTPTATTSPSQWEAWLP